MEKAESGSISSPFPSSPLPLEFSSAALRRRRRVAAVAVAVVEDAGLALGPRYSVLF